MTYICVGKLTIIGSDNGLSPGRRQAIIWTNAGILLIGTLGTKLKWNFNRNIVNWILGNKLQWNSDRNSNIFIQENTFESVVCEMAAILSRPQCFNVTSPCPLATSFLARLPVSQPNQTLISCNPPPAGPAQLTDLQGNSTGINSGALAMELHLSCTTHRYYGKEVNWNSPAQTGTWFDGLVQEDVTPVR